jgi:hypothetical protein
MQSETDLVSLITWVHLMLAKSGSGEFSNLRKGRSLSSIGPVLPLYIARARWFQSWI